jgi:hypothetical protein
VKEIKIEPSGGWHWIRWVFNQIAQRAKMRFIFQDLAAVAVGQAPRGRIFKRSSAVTYSPDPEAPSSLWPSFSPSSLSLLLQVRGFPGSVNPRSLAASSKEIRRNLASRMEERIRLELFRKAPWMPPRFGAPTPGCFYWECQNGGPADRYLRGWGVKAGPVRGGGRPIHRRATVVEQQVLCSYVVP